jgi:hypothetical protein
VPVSLRGPAGPAAWWADRRGGPGAGGPARVSAGVRNLDGMADGRSGCVRQCLRQHRTRSHTSGRGHAGRTPTKLTARGGVRGLRQQRFRSRVRPRAHELARPRGSRKPGQVSTLVAGVREAGGHPSGRSPRRGTPVWPLTAVWSRVPDTVRPNSGRPDSGRSGSSGRSIR